MFWTMLGRLTCWLLVACGSTLWAGPVLRFDAWRGDCALELLEASRWGEREQPAARY